MSLMLRSISAAVGCPYLKESLRADSFFFVLVRQLGPEEQIGTDRAEPVRIGSSAASDRGASLEGNPKTFFLYLPSLLPPDSQYEKKRLTSLSIF